MAEKIEKQPNATMITTPDGHACQLRVIFGTWEGNLGTRIECRHGSFECNKRSEKAGDIALVEACIADMDNLIRNLADYSPEAKPMEGYY